jgi:hypothetical protein
MEKTAKQIHGWISPKTESISPTSDIRPLEWGGLVRSAGGDKTGLLGQKEEDRELSDQRILGSGHFVAEVLSPIPHPHLTNHFKETALCNHMK